MIDGFNLYNSLKDSIDDGLSPSIVKWLDMRKMCERHISKFGAQAASFDRIVYCTSEVGRPGSEEQMRQKVFIKACHSQSIEVVYGFFKQKQVTCPRCLGEYNIQVEKQTDINVGLQVIRAGIDGFDGCMLVSGDSDLAAAMSFSRKHLTRMKLITLLPYKRQTSSLYNPNFGPINMDPETDYNPNVLPNAIAHPKKTIRVPKYWETGIK